MSTLAITGATGFVGGALLDLAVTRGHAVRALTRRPQSARPGVTWIAGALDWPDALTELVRGAATTIHVAGVVNARDRAGFTAGNAAGTGAILNAATDAGVRRFVHVSSLAAREPHLSDYGWSKAEAEVLVQASDRDWTIVRPTAVYGPGDLEMRDVFRLAQRGLALLPPPGRISLIAVADLAALLLAIAEHGAPRTVYEADDEAPVTHAEFARAVGAAVGRAVLPIHLPRTLLSIAARADGLFRGTDAKLTPDRVGYLVHPDWTADPARRPPQSLWMPETLAVDGLAATASWYRAAGLL